MNPCDPFGNLCIIIPINETNYKKKDILMNLDGRFSHINIHQLIGLSLEVLRYVEREKCIIIISL